MDEEKKEDIMETYDQPEPPLTWRDGATPLLALALAWLFWACFGLENLKFPHLGVLVLVAAHFIAVLLILGKQARLSAGSIFCMAAALALGVSCALYESGPFLVMNCFVILLAAALATFSLSGHLDPGRASAVPDAVLHTVLALCTRIDRPFRAAGRLRRQKGGTLGRGLLAVLVAVPVVAVVLWLLSSADAVFGRFFAAFDRLRLPENAVMRTARVLILALFLASALTYIREEPAAQRTPRPDRPRHAEPFLLVTMLLDIVYIIFCYIQIKYLFGGAEEASMAGGWAEYARSGFFQLVAITFINLGLFLLGADAGRFADRSGKLLRALYALLLVLTALILVSAFWRMRLYILAFGMSVLRLLTLWAMAVVLCGILAAAWKLAQPGFGFFRTAGGFALGLWCLMCLAGPCGMIANYNADKYLAGELSEMDADYLRGLGCDARAAMEKLADAGALESDGLPLWRTDGLTWAQMSLSAYRAGRSVRPAEPIEFETGELSGYKTILWEGRTYAPYGVLGAGRIALGARLGCLREDEESMVYAVGTADTEFWLAEYTDEGWMDGPPMVYRSLDAPDDVPVPGGVDSLGYDIWE